MDFITASQAMGRSAANLSCNGVGPRGEGVLVSGLEQTQGVDVLLSAGAVSPGNRPSKVEVIQCMMHVILNYTCHARIYCSRKTPRWLSGASSIVNKDGCVSTVTGVRTDD